MTWQGKRAGSLPRGVRRRIRARKYCEWPLPNGSVCGVLVPPGTGGVDHRVCRAEGGSSGDDNLWLLCSEHHDNKTRAEIERGKQRYRNRGRYDPGGHPQVLARGRR